MGFTPWPYDLTMEAVIWTDTHIKGHGDIIEQHFEEGVPWPEALANMPYQPGMNTEIDSRVRRMAGMKRIVSINPLNMARNGLAPYRGEKDNMPLPGKWGLYRLNDPNVKKAYLQYAEHIVQTMKPDYLLIGVEVNLLLRNRPDMWQDYLDLHKSTYLALKKRHPQLPVMVSLFCVSYFAGQSNEDNTKLQLQELKKILPYTDIVGYSVHPWMSSLLADSFPINYFDTLFRLAGKKPVAITESSYPAQLWDITIGGNRAVFKGSQEKQNAFLAQMLNAAQNYHLRFISWFAIRDYDSLWVKIGKPDSALPWRDTGLFDENGTPRQALQTWDKWLHCKRTP